MKDILIQKDKNGGTAILTVYSPLSHYGIPILRIEADDISGDFGPGDFIDDAITAADVIRGWLKKGEHLVDEIKAAESYLSQLGEKIE